MCMPPHQNCQPSLCPSMEPPPGIACCQRGTIACVSWRHADCTRDDASCKDPMAPCGCAEPQGRACPVLPVWTSRSGPSAHSATNHSTNRATRRSCHPRVSSGLAMTPVLLLRRRIQSVGKTARGLARMTDWRRRIGGRHGTGKRAVRGRMGRHDGRTR